jgi:hypothetical protein
MVVNCNLYNYSNSRRCFHSHVKVAFLTKYRATIYFWTRISIILCHCNNRPKKDKVTILEQINLAIKTRHRLVHRLSELVRKRRIFSKMIAMFLHPELLFGSITNKVRPNKFTFHLFRLQNNNIRAFIKTKAKCTRPLMESSSQQRSHRISAFLKTSRVKNYLLFIMHSIWVMLQVLLPQLSN